MRHVLGTPPAISRPGAACPAISLQYLLYARAATPERTRHRQATPAHIRKQLIFTLSTVALPDLRTRLHRSEMKFSSFREAVSSSPNGGLAQCEVKPYGELRQKKIGCVLCPLIASCSQPLDRLTSDHSDEARRLFISLWYWACRRDLSRLLRLTHTHTHTHTHIHIHTRTHHPTTHTPTAFVLLM